MTYRTFREGAGRAFLGLHHRTGTILDITGTCKGLAYIY